MRELTTWQRSVWVACERVTECGELPLMLDDVVAALQRNMKHPAGVDGLGRSTSKARIVGALYGLERKGYVVHGNYGEWALLRCRPLVRRRRRAAAAIEACRVEVLP